MAADRRTVGYAVVGLGVGKAHVQGAIKARNCELKAVCDIDESRLQSVTQDAGCDGYTDFAEMLKREDIDIVSVCTPSGMHADMVIQAAEAGKHVLCEKPLDIKLDRIDAMIQACRRNNVKLGGIFQRRLSPVNKLIKATLEEGKLGKLISGNVQVKWYRTQEYYEANGGWRGTWEMDGGGSLMNQSIHTIDLFQWLMGPVESVFAKTGVYAHDIETEDTGFALVTFKNGALGSIIGTTAAYPGLDTSVQIHGENGSIYTVDDKVVRWRIRGDNEEEEEKKMIAGYGSGQGGSGSSDPMAIATTGHAGHVQDIVDAVLEDRDPAVPGPAGRPAVEIILAIYESARTGKEVHLPL